MVHPYRRKVARNHGDMSGARAPLPPRFFDRRVTVPGPIAYVAREVPLVLLMQPATGRPPTAPTLRVLLHAVGVRLREFEDVDGAERWFGYERCDAILLDLTMPEADASALLRGLRRSMRQHDLDALPILGLVPADEALVSRLRRCGLDVALTAPLSRSDLLDALAQSLNTETGAGPSVALPALKEQGA